MDYVEVVVDMICPACAKQALMRGLSPFEGYMFRPKVVVGKVSCVHCGYGNMEMKISCREFYYQVKVGRRVLYAMNRERLVDLRDYFKERRKWDDEPVFDFPKEFYLCREEIVRKIEGML